MAQQHLRFADERPTRKQGARAYIVVLDNLAAAGTGTHHSKGQRIREEATLKGIFADSGLVIRKESLPTVLVADDCPVKAWALY